jgi:hypothetical protein
LSNTVTVDSVESDPATATLDIPISQVVNKPPVVGDDSYKTKKNTALSAKDFTAKVTFTYKANDGSLDSNVATVTISVTK